jgi:type I restriction enzyme R subunit
LLQASARVNRPYPNKEFGLIVDLTGVCLENYRKAIQEYNIYGQKEINEDILKHLFKDSGEIWETFVRKLETFKNLFEDITGLTLKEFSHRLKASDSERAKETIREVVGKILASNEGIDRLVPLLEELVKLYETLGGFPEKAKSEWRIIYKTLKTLQVAINRRLKPRKVTKIPKEIEEEILKTVEFGRLETLDELKIDEEVLEKFLNGKKGYLIISDWLIPLANLLEEELEEPLYRLIYKRLKKLEKDYRNKVLTVEKLIEELKHLTAQVKEYRNRLKTLSPAKRLIKAISYYLKEMEIKMPREIGQLEESLETLLKDITAGGDSLQKVRSQLRYLLIKAKVPAKEREKIIELLMKEVIIPYSRRFRNEA